MTVTWLELQRPLDPRLDQLLRDLDDQLRSRKIDYLLTGGMAREILLYYGYGCAPGRVTVDVDFGVALPSWEDFEALKLALVASEQYRLDPKETQRIIHRNLVTDLETRVDLVPFGEIAEPKGELAWPPDGSVVMCVLGYAQALSTAIHLRLDETRWIPLASASGIALMKLIAWIDRGEARLGRDAVDFIEILRQYSHVLTDTELYEEYPEAMERYDFRAEPAAARILGKQVAKLVDDHIRKMIVVAMKPESRIRMINFALRERGFMDLDEREVEAAMLLDAFEEGFHD